MQAAPLYIEGATLLGYSQSIEYFGSDIGFKKNIEITVECVSDDITGGPSSTSVFSLVDGVKDYGDLFINGQGFGPAKLTSFSAGETNMEDSISVSVSFLICEAFDDLSDLSGDYYGDYKAAGMSGCILDSFSDTLSLSRGENSTSYTRNLSITANNSQNLTDTAAVIRNYARVIFGFTTFSFPDLTAFDSQIEDLTAPNIKKNITETVDEIGLKFSFQESMSAGNVKGDYSLTNTHNYTKSAEGIITVSESGNILGLLEDRFGAAEAGYATELASAKGRMVAVFNGYNDDDCAPLNEKDGELLLLTSGKTENEFAGTIDYSVSSNNDPKYTDNDGNLWNYTTSVSSDGVFQTSTEQGTISGEGHEIYNDAGMGFGLYKKYINAKTFFMSKVANTVDGRLSVLISDPSPKPISRTERHAPVQGTIGYSRTFSNNPRYADNDGVAKSITTSTSTKRGVPTQSKFVCLPTSKAEGYELIQTTGPLSLEEVTSNIQMVGYRIDPSSAKSGATALGDVAKGKVSAGSTDFLSAIKYTFKGANNVAFTLSTTYLGGDSECP